MQDIQIRAIDYYITLRNKSFISEFPEKQTMVSDFTEKVNKRCVNLGVSSRLDYGKVSSYMDVCFFMLQRDVTSQL